MRRRLPDDAVASLRTLQARGFFPDAQIQLMLLEATEATDADALPKLEAELNTTLVALRARRARQVQRARSTGIAGWWPRRPRRDLTHCAAAAATALNAARSTTPRRRRRRRR